MLSGAFLSVLLLGVHFVDVAEQAGLSFQHISGSAEKNYILETIGSGVAWIDYDRDGWPDLFAVNGGSWEELVRGVPSTGNALFRNNRDGTFRDVTRAAGVAGSQWGMGATVADYDNDGWPDLYVCNYGPNTLYRNNGDGSFSDATQKAGVGDPSWSSSAAFGDADGDEWLDLYVANYIEFDHLNPPARSPDCEYRGIQVHCGPSGLAASADTFYHNNGDGTFSLSTKEFGMDAAASYGMGAVWCDYDNDRDNDLFVANDSQANFLFQNQGKGKFKEIALTSGVAVNEDGQAQAGMGVSFGDYDHDGYFDLYVTNFSDDYNTLYRNLGNGLFRDVTRGAALTLPSLIFLGWSAKFFDYDNDGWEDLLVANGHIYPQVDSRPILIQFRQRKLLFKNLGNGKFSEVGASREMGLTEQWSSRGGCFADFDNDGDVDIAVNNMDARLSLFRNEGGHSSGHWLRLNLEGRQNRSAIGTRVVVETDGRQMQEIRSGSGYQSSHDLRLHFGLGSSQRVKKLTIRWTNGEEQDFQDVAADRGYFLRQGKALASEKRFTGKK